MPIKSDLPPDSCTGPEAQRGEGAGGLSDRRGPKVPQRQGRTARDRDLTRRLRANSGLVTRRELEALGFTQREVTGLLAHGDLRRLHRGVFADGRAPLSDRAHLKAALLALRGERWLSGHAAAAGWGLELPSLIGIEVTVVASCTPTRRGLRITRTSRPPHPSELVTRNG